MGEGAFVIDSGRNFQLQKLLPKGVSFRNAQGVLGVNALVARFYFGRGNGGKLAEERIVSGGVFSSALQLGREMLALYGKDCRLNCIQSAVGAAFRIDTLGILSVAGEDSDALRQMLVIGKNGSSIAKRTEGLGRVKTGGRDGGEGAGRFAVLRRSETLGGVF